MQQVINAKERNQAFLQFLFLFLITVGLTLSATYFNFQLPTKVNKVLRDELDAQRSGNRQQQKFINHMNEANIYLDSLKNEGPNSDFMNMQLTDKLNVLSNLVQRDSSLYGQMNKVIFETFLELQVARKDLKHYSANLNKIKELDAELEKCNGKLSEVNGQ